MSLPEYNPQNGSGHRYTGRNYKQISLPGHPNACLRSDGLLYYHRYLAAKALGKALPVKAEVHHHNGSRTGGQLVICEDKAYHKLLHKRTQAYLATGDPNKKTCAFCSQWDDPENMIGYFGKNPNGRFHHASCKSEWERNYRMRRKAQ